MPLFIICQLAIYTVCRYGLSDLHKYCFSLLERQLDAENVFMAIQLSRQSVFQQPASLEKAAMKFIWDHWEALDEAAVIDAIEDAFPKFISQVVRKYKASIP